MAINKNRYTVSVAGIPLSLVTAEEKDFLQALAARLSDEIAAITSHSYYTTKLDAALLCALDAMGEKQKADERIRALEAALAERGEAVHENAEKLKSLERFLDSKVNG